MKKGVTGRSKSYFTALFLEREIQTDREVNCRENKRERQNLHEDRGQAKKVLYQLIVECINVMWKNMPDR